MTQCRPHLNKDASPQISRRLFPFILVLPLRGDPVWSSIPQIWTVSDLHNTSWVWPRGGVIITQWVTNREQLLFGTEASLRRASDQTRTDWRRSDSLQVSWSDSSSKKSSVTSQYFQTNVITVYRQWQFLVFSPQKNLYKWVRNLWCFIWKKWQLSKWNLITKKRIWPEVLLK